MTEPANSWAHIGTAQRLALVRPASHTGTARTGTARIPRRHIPQPVLVQHAAQR